MENHIVVLLFCVTVATANPLKYISQRAQLLQQEDLLTLGGTLNLNEDEEEANEILMTAKFKEIDQGFRNSSKYLPSHNFMKVKSSIEKSEVFKIIQQMPKGAILHVHRTSFTSEDYLYNNVTFRDNLYICDVNGVLNYRFFKIPDNGCDWKLLSELRKNASIADNLNKRIREQISMITPDPDKAYPDVTAAWNKFDSVFNTLRPFFDYRPVYEDYFYQGLLEAYEDNIMYIEYRTGIARLYDLNGTKYDPIDPIRIHKELVDRFVREHPDFMGARMIYAINRLIPQTELPEYLTTVANLKRAYPSFIAGFDLVGMENRGKHLNYFAETLQEIHPNVKLFLHAGETNWYGLPPDQNLIDAILLNTSRIGHGYALLKHPKAMELVKARDIAIEICPISNQVLGLVKDLRNHPGSALFAKNMPLVISNDDPGAWGVKGLSYDFYEAFMGLMSRKSDLRALKQLALNSIKYSSMDDVEKSMAFKIWQRKWSIFINNLRGLSEPDSSSTTSSYNSSEEDNSVTDLDAHWDILNGFFGLFCKININIC